MIDTIWAEAQTIEDPMKRIFLSADELNEVELRAALAGTHATLRAWRVDADGVQWFKVVSGHGADLKTIQGIPPKYDQAPCPIVKSK